MNQLDNGLNSFINTGLDNKICKAMDKTKLVQKEIVVQTKHGVVRRKQWVKAGDDKETDKPAPQQPSSDKGNGKYHKGTDNAKQKVQELTKGMNASQAVEFAKKNGITWDEHSHPGINCMRAKMALAKAIDNGTWRQQPKKATPKAKKVKEPPKVTTLQNMMDAKADKVVPKNTNSGKNKYGVTEGSKSQEESKKFGDALQGASEEDMLHYRTLGMCAGDPESAKYLANLYTKYTKVMGGQPSSNMTDAQRKANYMSQVLADPLRNKIQGVVNSATAKVVQNSVKDMRKKAMAPSSFLLTWKNPNLSDEVEKEIKNKRTRDGRKLDSLELERERGQYAEESTTEHKLMKDILDTMASHPDYETDAKDFKKLVTDFDSACKTMGLTPRIRDIMVTADAKKKLEELVDKETKSLSKPDTRLEEIDENIKAMKEDTYSSYYWVHSSSEEKKAILQNKEEERKSHIAYMERRKKDFESAKKLLTAMEKNNASYKKAVKAMEDMKADRFTDVRANLVHRKTVAKELTRQYFVKKDFVSDYPVLSKTDIDTLESGDLDAVTNLSLYAGSFKPSLAKGGKDANQAIKEKFSERKALLEAYGGVDPVTLVGSTEYAEDNEVKCKISKASSKDAKRIIDNIARDWDQKNHGRMKYVIKGVYQISGLPVEEEFKKIRDKKHWGSGKFTSGGKNCKTDFFYHGTGSMATSLILGHSGAFKVVKAKVGRMLGDGIYLADKSSKSAQYISDSGYSRSGIEGSLMIVEASLGKTESGRFSNNNPNYDSVYAGTEHGLLNKEWCVHDANAVIPRFLVEMEIK